MHAWSVPEAVSSTNLATLFSCTNTLTTPVIVGVELFGPAGRRTSASRPPPQLRHASTWQWSWNGRSTLKRSACVYGVAAAPSRSWRSRIAWRPRSSSSRNWVR